ncbi:MAG: tetratricopeptide repeat protein [Planctomycetota bacterium]
MITQEYAALGLSLTSKPSRQPNMGSSSHRDWIISPLWDGLFFIGTPVLLLAIVLPLSRMVPTESIALVMLALFAVGHHLPGFLRIYGDPVMFSRYSTRFLLGPPLVFMASLYFASKNLHGLILVSVLWDFWHSITQHYGMMRIYAAKKGEISHRLSWLDLALSFAWFLSIALCSPQYSMALIRPVIQTFGVTPSQDMLNGLRAITVTATAVCTVWWIGATVRAGRAGVPISVTKIALTLFTFAFLGVAWWLVKNLVLGHAMWAVYHDIQYFALVWLMGCGIAAKHDQVARPFLSFLFRRKFPLVLLYVAMFMLYGSMGFVQKSLENETLRLILGAFILTSALMHYYFDGFIWKVREPSLRAALGFETVSHAPAPLPELRRERVPLQLACLVIPLALLVVAEPSSRGSEDVYRALTSIYPGWGDMQFKLGDELADQGKWTEAAKAYHDGLAIQPDAPLPHENLATVYEHLGDLVSARYHLERAARLLPHDQSLQTRLASMRVTSASDPCCTRKAPAASSARTGVNPRP